jgi:mannose/fructose/N-acetylgalactosamine-specific phosphotransferase system component IIC
LIDIFLFIISGSWPTLKIVTVGLIALCIIGIILALVFLVISKKFKKNKRSATTGSTGTSQAVVTRGPATVPKYQQVPSAV